MMIGMRRLVVISTGGTIATAADANGTLRPVRSGAELTADVDVDLDVLDLMSVDSSELTPADWVSIGSAVEAAAARADGIVITHGSDTVEETALWLDLTYGGDVPVVLTCAVRPSDHPDADGPANVRDALAVAACPQARGLGVLISFGGLVRPPLGTTKLGGREIFGGSEPLGSVHQGRFTMATPRKRPYLGPVASVPRVDIVAAYPGADETAIAAFIAAGAQGLVLEAVGAGNAGKSIVAAIERACADGVVVAVSTRVPDSQVAANYGPGHDLANAGAVMLPGLRASQARVLLMAALGARLPVAEVIARWG